MDTSRTPVTAETVAGAAAGLGRELDAAQAAGLAAYLDLLVHWRRKINLVGPADWQTILATLVADSWHLADFLTHEAAGCLPAADAPLCTLDFGAGAGLPGIPLRLFWDRGDYVLLEARLKRVLFLGEAADRLRLPRTTVAEGRVETTVPAALARHPDAFALCLGRAFAPWPKFLDLCRGLVSGPMAVLAMTNDPVPARDVPATFSLTAQKAYPAVERTRHLTLFVPASQTLSP